jgi:hypothetical protein
MSEAPRFKAAFPYKKDVLALPVGRSHAQWNYLEPSNPAPTPQWWKPRGFV